MLEGAGGLQAQGVHHVDQVVWGRWGGKQTDSAQAGQAHKASQGPPRVINGHYPPPPNAGVHSALSKKLDSEGFPE